MVPAFIRYFATTDGSSIGKLALELAKSMQKVAPVRVATMNADIVFDAWLPFLTTPMVGSYVNVVACDPSKWVLHLNIAAPVRGGEDEKIAGDRSLYTAGVRNVLYAIAAPRGQAEIEAALQYESILVPNEEHRIWWKRRDRDVTIVGGPFMDSVVRQAICG